MKMQEKRKKDLKKPLTFKIISGGTISWNAPNSASTYTKSIQYRKNGGTWTTITSGYITFNQKLTTQNHGEFLHFGDVWSVYGYYMGDEINGRFGGQDVYSGNTYSYYFETTGNRYNVNDSITLYTWNDFEHTTGTSFTDTVIATEDVATGEVPTIEVSAGDILEFRGDNEYLSGNYFASTAIFSLENNIMSLVSSNNFASVTTVSTIAFTGLFKGCTSLTSASKLCLPATNLRDNCYNKMFAGCTSLTTAPELPATTLAQGCYEGMFSGCTSLNYIKAMFTSTPGSSYTYNWVSGVAASGTFVKNSAATWNVTGVNGVPNGWTIETA